MTMTVEPSDFPYGHGQNDHFDHDHNTIFIIKWFWSKLTDISTISMSFDDFNSKKSGIVEMVMIKFDLTILTTEILGMVMVKFGSTILTIEPQFGHMVK
jgi:hypothetical protein